MPDWLRHATARLAAAGRHGGLWLALALSVGLAIVSLVIAAIVVVSWPADRFKDGASAPFLASHPPPVRILAHVGKNVLGVVLVLLGLVMALPGVPGQGVLTMIIGFTLVDFPGKVEIERRLVSRPLVLRSLNALRRRFHRAPLDIAPRLLAPKG